MPKYSDYIYYGRSRENFEHFQSQLQETFGVELKYFDDFETLYKYFQENIGHFLSVIFYEQSPSLMADLRQLTKLNSYDREKLLFLVGKGFSLLEKKSYLEAGVTNTISYNANKDVFQSLKKYIHLYFEATAQAERFDAPASSFPKLRIPIGKRLFDIAVSSFLILMLSPLLITVYLAIIIESKGPAVYRSKRIGAGYYMFDFYKFRSMYADADKRLKEYMMHNQYAKQETVVKSNSQSYANAEIPQFTIDELRDVLIDDDAVVKGTDMSSRQKKAAFFKLEKDPRVTKVGRILRKYSIDELPQLFNTLFGDMSIVGNRPLPLYEAEMLTTDDSVERFMAPAGITGLWQVEKRGDNGSMSDQERINLDIDYAKNYSVWMDVKILFKTFSAFIQKADV
ncbi:MAG TPA: sugar transferase [Sphingobacterium sp.]|nr:Undecaprenyl-phosphate galactosephosphotransferase [Sphingobacterium faecium PCAi_F2.5]HCU46395.1 sugar transferase [Sphingobacterium sp.]